MLTELLLCYRSAANLNSAKRRTVTSAVTTRDGRSRELNDGTVKPESPAHWQCRGRRRRQVTVPPAGGTGDVSDSESRRHTMISMRHSTGGGNRGSGDVTRIRVESTAPRRVSES